MPDRLDEREDGVVGRLVPEWLRWPLLIGVVAGAYALAARLGLALAPPPEHIALFWPASGLAAGLLIAMGREARVSIAAAVALTTLIANLATRSGPGAGVVLALCNALECLAVAWIVERLDPDVARLERLRSFIVFMFAALAGSALAAVPAALALRSFGLSQSSLSDLWFVWFKSDAMGIVTIAPLLITLPTLLHAPLAPRRFAEGIAVIVLTGLATNYALGLGADNIAWMVVAPATLLFPLLLWLAVRMKPVFTAAAVCLFALVVTLASMRGAGWLGDPALPLSVRVLAGQFAMLTFTACGLSLTAILADLGNVASALKATEERLRLGLNAGAVYAFDFDPVARRGHRAGALADRLGLPAQGQLDDYHDRLHPDDRARFQAHMQALSPAAPTFSDQVRLRAVDGGYLVVVHRTEASFDARGRIARIVGTCTDVTRQNEVEQALRDSEERLRLGLNAGGVYAFDFDCIAGEVHRFGGLIDRLGLLAKGRHGEYSDRLHPDDRARFKAKFRGISPDEPYFEERFRLRAVDGRYLFVVHCAEGRFDAAGNKTRVVGTCADVTPQRLAEQALHDSQQRLHAALRLGRVFAFDWDAASGLGRRSDNAAEILGITPEQVQMTRAEFGACVHPDDIKGLTAKTEAMTLDTPTSTGRFRFLRPDRQVIWLEVSQGGTFDAARRLVRVSGLTRDVTERVLAEERQARLIGELDHRVKNILARVRIMIERTGEGPRTLEGYVQALEGRIMSMTRTHERLSASKWDGVGLAELVADELAPYRTDTNTSVEGPDIMLAASAAQSMSMTLHELATNAVKHGALSRASGRIMVRWQLQDRLARASANEHVQGPGVQGQAVQGPALQGRVLMLDWIETTDWDIDANPTEGFGVSTIKGILSFEQDADVRLEFTARGARCTIIVPAEQVSRAGPDPAVDTAGAFTARPTAAAGR